MQKMRGPIIEGNNYPSKCSGNNYRYMINNVYLRITIQKLKLDSGEIYIDHKHFNTSFINDYYDALTTILKVNHILFIIVLSLVHTLICCLLLLFKYIR